jgi:hypothetical protein
MTQLEYVNEETYPNFTQPIGTFKTLETGSKIEIKEKSNLSKFSYIGRIICKASTSSRVLRMN